MTQPKAPSIPTLPGADTGPPPGALPPQQEHVVNITNPGAPVVPATQPPPITASPQAQANTQAAAQASVASGETKEKPPMFDWVQRNSMDRSLITVQHQEINGGQPTELKLNKYTFNIRNLVGRVKGQLYGAFPDPECDDSVELQAVVTCGVQWKLLATAQSVVDPGEFTDDDLMYALYREVNEYWNLFRGSK